MNSDLNSWEPRISWSKLAVTTRILGGMETTDGHGSGI